MDRYGSNLVKAWLLSSGCNGVGGGRRGVKTAIGGVGGWAARGAIVQRGRWGTDMLRHGTPDSLSDVEKSGGGGQPRAGGLRPRQGRAVSISCASHASCTKSFSVQCRHIYVTSTVKLVLYSCLMLPLIISYTYARPPSQRVAGPVRRHVPGKRCFGVRPSRQEDAPNQENPSFHVDSHHGRRPSSWPSSFTAASDRGVACVRLRKRPPCRGARAGRA